MLVMQGSILTWLDFRVTCLLKLCICWISRLRKLICNVNFHIWYQVRMDISSRDGHVCQVTVWEKENKTKDVRHRIMFSRRQALSQYLHINQWPLRVCLLSTYCDHQTDNTGTALTACCCTNPMLTDANKIHLKCDAAHFQSDYKYLLAILKNAINMLTSFSESAILCYSKACVNREIFLKFSVSYLLKKR